MSDRNIIGKRRVRNRVQVILVRQLLFEHYFAHVFFRDLRLLDEKFRRFYKTFQEAGGDLRPFLVKLFGDDQRADGGAHRRIVRL